MLWSTFFFLFLKMCYFYEAHIACSLHFCGTRTVHIKFSSYCYSYRFHCFQFVGHTQCKKDQTKVHVIIIVHMIPFLVGLFFLMDGCLSLPLFIIFPHPAYFHPLFYLMLGVCVYFFLFVWENFQEHCNKLVVNTCSLFILVFMTWLESKVIFSQNSGTEWRLFLFKRCVIQIQWKLWVVKCLSKITDKTSHIVSLVSIQGRLFTGKVCPC